ncbi:hypothetical protein [Actinocorallia longicatena]|uniref:FXSXX-COOH protein n=1 Tax=Actinocorallia longicatena TaxID=111803 RepID=A0ABP6QG75_9ACTN
MPTQQSLHADHVDFLSLDPTGLDTSNLSPVLADLLLQTAEARFAGFNSYLPRIPRPLN